MLFRCGLQYWQNAPMTPNIKMQKAGAKGELLLLGFCPLLISSVSQSRAMRGGYQRGYNVSTSAGCGLGSGEVGQNWQLARDPPRKAAA